MRVFVTGGSGLVGRQVVAALVRRGDTVQALARSDGAAAELRALGAEPVRGDLTNEASLVGAMEGAAAVVHTAAVVLSRRDWTHFHACNVAPTAAVARAAAARGARLVHLSSVAVYGRRTTYDGGAGSVREDFGLERPLFSGDHYARSKREAELAVWEVARETGLAAVALRPCVIYGEHDRTFGVRVAAVLRRTRGVAPLVGGGRHPMPVVYAGNVAAAVLCALDRPGVTGPFNVANDGGITAREFLAAFAEGLGLRLRGVSLPQPLVMGTARAVDAVWGLLRQGSPMATAKAAMQFIANPNPYVSARAERELGWRPVVAPRDAVLRTARWFRDRTP